MMPHRTPPLPRDAHKVHVIVYAFVRNVENATWAVSRLDRIDLQDFLHRWGKMIERTPEIF